MTRRVVITGLGIVSPLGLSKEENLQSLKQGRSGISKITLFDASNFASQIAGEVKNFDPHNYLDPKEAKRMDRFIHFALAATQEAWRSSNLSGFNPSEAGCILGVGIGGLEYWERYHSILIKEGPKKISPFLIPAMISNLASGYVSIKYHLKGLSYAIASACASSAHAIGEAYRYIKDGYIKIAVAGGAEAAITPLGVGGFAAMRALSCRNDEPEKASRPWDIERDGFVIAEGAAALILEELNFARSRGASIVCEICGYAANCDAYHITAPSEKGEGAKACMEAAIWSAGLQPQEIDYINAHATSTPAGDASEAEAIKQVFAGVAKKPVVSSTKSLTGHTLGAAGAIEAVFTCLAIQNSFIPPTINLKNVDPVASELDLCPNIARPAELRYAMSNSFGFGGTNACLIFKKWEE